MKAVLCTRPSTPDDLTIAKLPDPIPGPGEAIVRVAATALMSLANRAVAAAFNTLLRLRGEAVVFEHWLPAYTTKVIATRGLDGAIIPVRRAECLGRAGDFPHGNTCVVRKSLLEDIGGYWEGVRYASDMDLFVRMADRAREIYFQCATVACHEVPDPGLRNNVSTRRSADGKAFDLAMIAEHLMFHCSTPEARAYAKELGGQARRELALSFVHSGDRVAAATWARQALVLRPTWKWLAYTGALRFGAMFTRPH